MAALLLATGCGPRESREPFAETRPPPGLEARFYPPEGWAWGLVQVGEAPAARYGVSAPNGQRRADLLILAAYGEPAEVWFETVRALNGRGYVVWVLEPIGQGGSGRYALPRDLAHAPSLGPDAETLRALAGRFVRRRPLVVLASRTAAPQALGAYAEGLAMDGLVLSAPALSLDRSAPEGEAVWMRRVGMGAQRAPGGGPWRREGPDDRALGLTHDGPRGKLRPAWQMANPDLRMGGPSWGWYAAMAEANAAILKRSLDRADAPVLVLDGADARELCRRFRTCASQAFPRAGAALQLEADPVRGPWLLAVAGFIEAQIARFAPRPAAARVEPEGTELGPR